jgi:hypothetical protein
MNEIEHKLPLGIIRQACMKLDSFMSDMAECREDADVDKDIIEKFTQLMELAGTMQATLVNIVSSECDEEDFLNEAFDMDSIDEWGNNAFTEDEGIEDIRLDDE